MKIQQTALPRPPCLEVIDIGGTVYVMESKEDYTRDDLPEPLAKFLADRSAGKFARVAQRTTWQRVKGWFGG